MTSSMIHQWDYDYMRTSNEAWLWVAKTSIVVSKNYIRDQGARIWVSWQGFGSIFPDFDFTTAVFGSELVSKVTMSHFIPGSITDVRVYGGESRNSHHAKAEKCYTVKPRSNGPATNEIPPITDYIHGPFMLISFIFFVGNNRSPPITD